MSKISFPPPAKENNDTDTRYSEKAVVGRGVKWTGMSPVEPEIIVGDKLHPKLLLPRDPCHRIVPWVDLMIYYVFRTDL